MKNICWIVFAVMVGSCSMNTELELDIVDEKPKLVAYSVFGLDSAWEIELYASQGMLARRFDPVTVVQDAEVVIIDGERHIPITWNGFVYRSTERPQLGRVYQLHVSAPGYASVQATAAIPEPVKIIGVKTSTIPHPQYPGNLLRTFEITFKDKPSEANFYGLSFIREELNRENGEVGAIVSPRPDPALPGFNEELDRCVFYQEKWGIQEGMILFKDVLFDGEEFTLTLTCQESLPHGELWNREAKSYDIFLRSFGGEYHEYITSDQLQMLTATDPFAQPVQVFSNINNGYGLFTGYSQDLYHLELK